MTLGFLKSEKNCNSSADDLAFAFHHSLSLVDTSMRTLPQHLTQGASKSMQNSFPLTWCISRAKHVRVYTPANGNANQSERPTAAQAAAGRLQRASARQAAKAAQQQKRHAQARAAAKKGAIAGVKRKKDESTHNDDDESDEDCSADAGANEPGDDTQAGKPMKLRRANTTMWKMRRSVNV